MTSQLCLPLPAGLPARPHIPQEHPAQGGASQEPPGCEKHHQFITQLSPHFQPPSHPSDALYLLSWALLRHLVLPRVPFVEPGAEQGGLGIPWDCPASPPALCPAAEEEVVPEMIVPAEISQVFPFALLSGVAQPVAEGEIEGGSCWFNASRCRPAGLPRPQHHGWGKITEKQSSASSAWIGQSSAGTDCRPWGQECRGSAAPRGTWSKG